MSPAPALALLSPPPPSSRPWKLRHRTISSSSSSSSSPWKLRRRLRTSSRPVPCQNDLRFSTSHFFGVDRPCELRALHLPPRRSAALASAKNREHSCICHAELNSESEGRRRRRREEVGSASVEFLQDFVKLNVGSWTGSFTQYDSQGNTLQQIPTRLMAYSYGKGDQVSLYQTLNIKQAPSKTFISGEDYEEVEWAEFRLDETNRLTINKQQVGYFPRNNAYAVSHQTAEMLDKIIRTGVLGEDDGDDLNDLPEGLRLPSHRPALVCESCLYSEDGMNRLRAFHVLDPRGLLDFMGVFEESKADAGPLSSDEDIVQDECRLDALLGTWSGHSVTRRSGSYGSTLVEEDTLVNFTLQENGSLIQDIKTPKGRIQLVGSSYGNMLKFDKGLQMTLLPRGLAMASPTNVGQTVNRSQAFYFEFSWVYAPGKRRRLVRTYDTDGVVVSSTFIDEVKL